MKKIAALLLFASLNLVSQTKIKFNQLENPGTSSVNLGANTFSAGTINGSSFIKNSGTSSQFLKADGSVDANSYLTTGSAASTYVPYSGATGSVNLGTQTFSAGAITGSNVIAKGTFSVNGASTFSNSILGLSSFSIDASGGVNSLSPKKFSISELPSLPGYFMMHSNQNIPSLNNYTIIWDSTFTGFNAPKTLALRQNSWIGFQMVGSEYLGGNTGIDLAGGVFTFLSPVATTTAAANNCIPMMKYGSHTYSLTGGTVPTFAIERRNPPDIRATTPTTLTNYELYNFPAPVLSPSITITNNYGVINQNNFTNGGRMYVGSQTAPVAGILNLANGNATTSAIQMTSQAIYTTGTAGAIWYNATAGFVHQGGIQATGNSTLQANTAFGTTVAPTSKIHIGANTAAASSAPIKFTSTGAVVMTSPEAGAMEMNASGVLFFTPTVSRYQVGLVLSATATLDFPNTLTLNSSDLTITVTGAAVGDAVSIGIPAAPNSNSCFTGFVSAANTVTIRFNNYSALAINPASATYKATVIKN